MFNLEHSIAEWQQQMLAAGIKAPVPLEELEGHLREKVEEQVKLGLNEQHAFEATLLQIGQGQDLQAEFAKDRDWGNLLRGNNLPKRLKWMLWLWVGLCILEYVNAARSLTVPLLINSSVIIGVAAYMGGIFWSIFLANTTRRACRIIQVITTLNSYLFLLLAILSLVGLVRHSFHLRPYVWMIPLYFNQFTVLLLVPHLPAEPKKATE